MWAMIVMGVLNGISAIGSNKIARANAKMAASQAELNALLAEANYKRRSQYRNEELGQQVWNLSDQMRTFMGQQRATMAATGFDISTGDQRILNDTLRRNLEKISGLNRTYYLQQFEDQLQTENDILQYNFDAYAQRQIAKSYSGWKGAARVAMAAGTGALGAYQPSGNKGGISSNTGADKASALPGSASSTLGGEYNWTGATNKSYYTPSKPAAGVGYTYTNKSPWRK